MNPHTARDPLSQRILDLTLEMIFLLTGEVDMKVRLHSQIQEQNHEKILELSNQIIRLLTGEVPIRCEDVTVYLSMEEWEYVERHKELYEDVMMEDHQPVITLDKSVSGEMNTPASVSDFGTDKTDNGGEYLNKATKAHPISVKYTKQECVRYVERCITNKDLYATTEHPVTDIKEELASSEEENVTQHTFICTRAESQSRGRGDTLYTDVSPLPEHTQSEYPSTDIKEESPTYGEGNLTDSDMYEPPEDALREWTPDNFGDYLKDDANPIEMNQSGALFEPRKPDHTVCCTGLVAPHSVHAPDMEPFFYSESDLVIYETQCREEEPFSSSVCGEHLTLESALKYQLADTEGHPFSCPECGKHFTDVIALKKHQIQTGRKLFKCSECDKWFTRASNLFAHKMIHRGEKPFHCSECAKCFTRASTLAVHKMIHTGEKPFNCTECGKCYSNLPQLTRHELSHTGEKPFACAECGKSFTQASHFVTHKMIHTGEKPFKCTECGKCFIRASSLARHNLTHTGEKPFSCTECGKCFSRNSSLAAHKRIHTGEKPFECPECGKLFTWAADLARHKMAHTGEKPFKCSECGKCFTRATLLSAHKLIHTK
uniref:C2H2-type domain-containing protein n=1 Tax=Leptobrachium leishanense TaxID=445787 RepID=A0A8C5Q2L2_9ANUR